MPRTILNNIEKLQIVASLRNNPDNHSYIINEYVKHLREGSGYDECWHCVLKGTMVPVWTGEVYFQEPSPCEKAHLDIFRKKGLL